MWAFLPRATLALRAQTSITTARSATTRVVVVSHVNATIKNIVRPFTISSYLRETEATSTTVKRVTRQAAAGAIKAVSTTSGRKRATTKAASTSTSKTKAKAKAKPKKKKKAAAKPKPKPKKRVVKPETKRKKDIYDLRKVALLGKEPKKLPENVWLVYSSRALKGAPGGAANLTIGIRSIAASYKTLAPSETEALTKQVHDNRAANRITHRAWLDTHTPAEIQQANNARRRLGTTFKVKSKQLHKIVDERQPKRNLTAYTLFSRSKWAHNHYRGSIVEAARSIAADWKALSPSEKEPFVDMALAEKERYLKEVAKLAADS